MTSTRETPSTYTDTVLFEDDNERIVVTTTTTVQRIVKTADGPVIEDEETFYGHLPYAEIVDRVRDLWMPNA